MTKHRFAALGPGSEVLKVVAEEFGLEGCPGALGFDPGFGFVGFKCTTAETDGELVEVAFEGVGGGGMVCHGFVVGMKEFATLAGGGVGDPDAGGVALEVDQADAGGCHLVVERLHAVTDFE